MRKRRAVMLVLLCCLLLAGCSRERYTKEQKAAVEERGIRLMEEYLTSARPLYALDGNTVHMVSANEPWEPYGDAYLSPVVTGVARGGGEAFRMYVNADTGELYADTLTPAVREETERQIRLAFEAAGLSEPVTVERMILSQVFTFPETPANRRGTDTVETQIKLTDAIPTAVGEEQIADYVANGFGNQSCSGITLRCPGAKPEHFKTVVAFFKENGGFTDDVVLEYRRLAEDARAGIRTEQTETFPTETPVSGPEATPGPDCDVRIEYDRPAALTRWPHFRKEDGAIIMSFNGRDWYRVRIVTGEAAERIRENRELLAESENMRAYPGDTAEYPYLYLMETGGSCYLRFDASSGPELHGYGNDFTTGIRFYRGDMLLEPVVPGKE